LEFSIVLFSRSVRGHAVVEDDGAILVNGVDISKLPGLRGISGGEIISSITVSAANRVVLTNIYTTVLATYGGTCDSDNVISACFKHGDTVRSAKKAELAVYYTSNEFLNMSETEMERIMANDSNRAYTWGVREYRCALEFAVEWFACLGKGKMIMDEWNFSSGRAERRGTVDSGSPDEGNENRCAETTVMHASLDERGVMPAPRLKILSSYRYRYSYPRYRKKPMGLDATSIKDTVCDSGDLLALKHSIEGVFSGGSSGRSVQMACLLYTENICEATMAKERDGLERAPAHMALNEEEKKEEPEKNTEICTKQVDS